MKTREELIKIYNDCNLTNVDDSFTNHLNIIGFIMEDNSDMTEVYLSLGNMSQEDIQKDIVSVTGIGSLFSNVVDFCIYYFKPKCTKVLLEYGFKPSKNLFKVECNSTIDRMKLEDMINICAEYNITVEGIEEDGN